MKVLLTGGTGFVGSHVAAALQAAGHVVRLLAREPAKVVRVLTPFTIQVDDVVQGAQSARPSRAVSVPSWSLWAPACSGRLVASASATSPPWWTTL